MSLTTTVFASIPSPPINDVHIGPLRLTFYGLLIGIGVAVAWSLAKKRFAGTGGDPALAEKIITRMVIIGFLGARLAYVSTHFYRYRGEVWKVLAIWEGGLALFGGLTAGAIAFYVTARRLGVDRRQLLDAIAPAVPLAQAIGRWGNYFNQELFGTPSNLPWAVAIDPRNRPVAYPDAATFHPTFLYESIWNLALAGFVIWAGRRFPALRSKLVGVYLAGYAVMRFVLELIRTDTTFRFLGLSRNGWVSIGVVLIGIAVIAYPTRNRDTVPAAPSVTTDAPPAQ